MTPQSPDALAKDQRNRSSAAQAAAMRRLKKAHEAEYRAYYREEAAARGVTVRDDARLKKIEKLRRELAALEASVSPAPPPSASS